MICASSLVCVTYLLLRVDLSWSETTRGHIIKENGLSLQITPQLAVIFPAYSPNPGIMSSLSETSQLAHTNIPSQWHMVDIQLLVWQANFFHEWGLLEAI